MTQFVIIYFFLFIMALLLMFCGLIIIAAKRAVGSTQIPVPPFWKWTTVATFLLILSSILYLVINLF